MKKKIAFLLAAVMAVAPATAFAAKIEDHNPKVPNVPAGTLVVHENLYSGRGVVNSNSAGTYKEQGINGILGGQTVNLVLQEGDTLKEGDSINVELKNAQAWYVEDTSGSYFNFNYNGKSSRSSFEIGTGIGQFQTQDRYDIIQNTNSNLRNHKKLTYTGYAKAKGLSDAQIKEIIEANEKKFTNDTIYLEKNLSINLADGNNYVFDAGDSIADLLDSDYFSDEGFKHSDGSKTKVNLTTKQPEYSFDYNDSSLNEQVKVNYILTTNYDNNGNSTITVTIDNIDSPGSVKGNVKASAEYTFSIDHYLGEEVDTGEVDDNGDPIYETKWEWTTGVNKFTADVSGKSADIEEEITDIKLGEGSSIDIPVVYKTTSARDVTGKVIVNASGISKVTDSSLELTLGSEEGKTTFEATTIASARETADLNSLIVRESVSNVIQNGYFEMSLNSGFKFENKALSVVTASPEWGSVKFMGYNENRTTAYFYITRNSLSYSNPAWFEVMNATISRTNDYYNYDSETAKITVKNLPSNQSYSAYYYEGKNLDEKGTITTGSNNSTGISTQTKDVATFNNYGLYFGYKNKDDKPTVAYAGVENVVTPVVEIGERAVDSWWLNRTTRFTLVDEKGDILDGAKIAKANVVNTHNCTHRGPRELYKDEEIGANSSYYTFNRSYVEYKDLVRTSATTTAGMDVQFTINTAANFEGDVYLQVSGTGINEDTDVLSTTDTIKLAEIKAPIKIETQTTEVTIGHQTYNTKAVTIEEAERGLLKAGKVVSLIIDEFASAGKGSGSTTDVAFNPIKLEDNVKVEEGSTFTFNKVTLGGNTINLAISKPSYNRDKNPARFTIDDLAVKINRSVPSGNYDLVVGGSAITQTYKEGAKPESAYFPIEGVIFEDYVKVATAGDSSLISRNVKITPGASVAYVDGKELDFDPVAFIDAETGRTMIPLRMVSKVLGIADQDVQWDPESSTAIIFVKSQNDSRVVSFTNGSSDMYINGQKMAMYDEKGVAVKPIITEETGRMFLPLRQLGIAFGIDVGWDGTNAYFNPTSDQVKE